MKFTLEIELGNEAMRTGEDVLNAIHQSVAGGDFRSLDDSDGGTVRDASGNTVGKWEVTESAKTGISQETADFFNGARSAFVLEAASEALKLNEPIEVKRTEF